MNDKALGFVLKQSDYRENDALISFYSFEYGKLSFVAKGIRKNGSKNSGSLFPFSLTEVLFDYKEEKELFVLHSANLKKSYPNIQTDLNKISAATFICDLCDQISYEIDDKESIEYLYHLMETCLEDLNRNNDINVVCSLFIANVLELMGISPEVDECCLCGNTSISAISVEDGGFVCSECSNKKDDITLLRQFRYVNKARYNNLDVLKKFGPYRFDLVEYLYSFLSMYLGVNLKSYEFIKQINV